MSLWTCAQIDPLSAASPPAVPETGEQLVTSFEHSWPWPSWITLLLLLVGATLIILVYLREQGGATRIRRLTLAAVRIALLLLVTFMLYGWTRQRHRMDLPDLIVAVDNSASMAVVDQDPDDSVRNQRQRQVRAAGFEQASRFNLAPRCFCNRIAAGSTTWPATTASSCLPSVNRPAPSAAMRPR